MNDQMDYRVVEKKVNDHVYYELREVFYHSDGNIESISPMDVIPFGQTVAELKLDVEKMLAAFDKPELRME